MQPNSIFLSYRRKDSGGDVRYLYDLLNEGLGDGRIFVDVDSIAYGEDFVEVIDRTLQNCQVVLVVIGPNWLRAQDERGRLRLELPNDPVRVEVVQALAMGVKIIPVLVGGAMMPDEEELPEGLKLLSRRNAFTLSDGKRFKQDVQELISTLKKIPPKIVENKTDTVPIQAESEQEIRDRLAKEVFAALRRPSPPKVEVKPVPIEVVVDPIPELESSSSRWWWITGAALLGSVIFWRSGNTQQSVPDEPDFVIPSVQLEVAKECVKGACFEMVAIPAGTFQMGSPDTESGRDSDEGPVHTVNVRGFWMGKTEVTQGLWKAVMGSNPSKFSGFFSGCDDTCPVERVSWNDAQEFIKKLNGLTGKKYRLPSEAEWEYAARAGTKTRWSFGDQESQLGEYAWYNSNSDSKTHPVGQKKPNPWGLYDMHGNVDEWVQDVWVDNYNGAPTDGSAREGNNVVARVLRGGSWYDYPQGLRSASRYGFSPDDRYDILGLRLARTN